MAVGRCRRALLRYGVAAGVEHFPVLRALSVDTVLDIGANRGQFALAVRASLPGARVVSFEPLDVPAQRFEAVFAADPLVTLHRTAIGPQSEQTRIHVSARDDSSSLLPISDLQDELFPGTAETAVEQIRVAPLETYLSAADIATPSLLKLDVQGYELEALKGCESLLGHMDHVYAECSFVELYTGQALADEIIGWLRGRGYAVRGVYNLTYNEAGQAIQGDFLFSRDGSGPQRVH
ncbi:FkbM family methyltransferase [Ectothiorhodospiraceae bacterium WFHF3C12]|nr:FkbM family methyltransferase [Ectothiorhodospiraceae bacterium WFHF3C12]